MFFKYEQTLEPVVGGHPVQAFAKLSLGWRQKERHHPTDQRLIHEERSNIFVRGASLAFSPNESGFVWLGLQV